MWSTWFSVLIRYRIGPCVSASARIATARVGSCGVSITTTPADVTTKLGLQPRSFVFVKTLAVTRSIIEVIWSVTDRSSLGRGESAIDGQDVACDERGGIGAQKDRRPDEVTKLPDPAQWNPVDNAGLEVGIGQERGDLRRVDKGRHDRVGPDSVLRPCRRLLAGERADRALRGDVSRIAGVDPERRPDGRQV